MTLEEVGEEIEQSERDWRKIADPELKQVAWEICLELYEKRDALEQGSNGK